MCQRVPGPIGLRRISQTRALARAATGVLAEDGAEDLGPRAPRGRLVRVTARAEAGPDSHLFVSLVSESNRVWRMPGTRVTLSRTRSRRGLLTAYASSRRAFTFFYTVGFSSSYIIIIYTVDSL